MMEELFHKLTVLNKCIGNGLLELNAAEIEYSKLGRMKKVPVAMQNIQAGDKLTYDLVAFKRTKQKAEIDQLEIKKYIGEELLVDVMKDEVFLKKYF
jgi:sialic acid synthase SpsE